MKRVEAVNPGATRRRGCDDGGPLTYPLNRIFSGPRCLTFSTPSAVAASAVPTKFGQDNKSTLNSANEEMGNAADAKWVAYKF